MDDSRNLYTILVIVAFTKKEKQTYNDLVSILVFVCESYLLCASCIFRVMQRLSKSITSYVFLSMNMMSTSNFEYE